MHLSFAGHLYFELYQLNKIARFSEHSLIEIQSMITNMDLSPSSNSSEVPFSATMYPHRVYYYFPIPKQLWHSN